MLTLRFRPGTVVCGIALCVLSADSAWAQTSSLFGSSGGRSGGSSSSLGRSGSSSSLGSSLGSSFGSGTSGFGSTAGGSAGGRGGTGFGQTGQSGFGAAQGMNFNQSGFVGRSDSTGRFVGNARATQTGANGGGNTRNFNAMNLADTGNRGRTNASSTNSSLSQFRPQQRIAFDYQPAPQSVLQERVDLQIEQGLKRLPPLPNSDIAAEIDGTTVVLTGTVASEQHRKLLEQLIRLEPGVRQIRNEIQVSAAN